MATSLRLLHGTSKHLRRLNKNPILLCSKRYLLSESYACNEAWRKHLQDPNLQQVSLSEFSFQVVEQLEKTGYVSSVDMNVLAHQFLEMDEDDVDFIEDILAKFNLSQGSIPHNDSTSHAIIRGFLSTGHGNHLVNILADCKTYGIFPNHYTLNILLDSLIRENNFSDAAKIAYHTMLQEDFSNPTNTVLSLHSSVQHLLSSNLDDLAPPPKEASDGEEDWIKVKYIKWPYYDDHFDIKDERFLLGKTLMMLADVNSVDLPDDIRTSLKLMGSGIYHKFPRGLACLSKIVNSPSGSVPQQALDYFSESLEKVEARDPNEPEVELALRTIDDEIHRMLPTTEEKETYQAELGKMKEQLAAGGRIVQDLDLGKAVQEFVTANLPKYEPSDIDAQQALFKRWTEERQEELTRQIEELRKNERIEEMKREIKELQEQEELLTYFDFEEKIRLNFVEEDREKDPGLTISK